MLTCTKRQNTRLTHTQVSALGTVHPLLSQQISKLPFNIRSSHSVPLFARVLCDVSRGDTSFSTNTLLARKYATDPHDAATPTVTSKSSSLSRLLFHWFRPCRCASFGHRWCSTRNRWTISRLQQVMCSVPAPLPCGYHYPRCHDLLPVRLGHEYASRHIRCHTD